MNEEHEDTGAAPSEGTVAIVAVPDHLVEQVLEFVNQLPDVAGSEDVSAYMISSPISLNSAAASKKTGTKATGCFTWDTGLPMGGLDFQCAD